MYSMNNIYIIVQYIYTVYSIVSYICFYTHNINNIIVCTVSIQLQYILILSFLFYYSLTVVGGVFLVEHLSVIKLLIEKLSKYLLLPGLDLEINMNIRVSTCYILSFLLYYSEVVFLFLFCSMF